MNVDRDVAERDDADELRGAIEHGQAADLIALHELHGFVDFLVFEDGNRAGRHGVANEGGFGIATVGDDLEDDVAVGEHADDLFVFEHGHDADVVESHEAGGLDYGGVGSDEARPFGHHLADFHERRTYVGEVGIAMGRTPVRRQGWAGAVQKGQIRGTKKSERTKIRTVRGAPTRRKSTKR